MEYVPVGVEAEADIINVEELVGYKDDGLNEHDAPEGSPEHENDTGFEAPDMSVAVAVVDMLLPCKTEPFDGLKDREKSNGTETGMTVRLYVAFLVMLPPAPLTVIEYVPVGVEAEADIINVEELVGYKDDGLNEHDAPEGSPEHENDTGFEAPDMSVAVAVVDVFSLWTTEPFDGLKDMEKLNGTGGTTVTSRL